MKKVWFYTFRQVLLSILTCTFLLFSLVTFIIFFGELDSVGVGKYSFLDAFIYAISVLTAYFYYLFPFCCLLGVLFAFGILQKNNELIIIRLSGYSAFKLTVGILSFIFLLILTVNIFDEAFGPELERKAELRKSTKKHNIDYQYSRSGVWLHLKDNFYYIGFLSGKNTVNNIYRFKVGDKKSTRNISEISYAKFAEYKNNKWTMKDIKKIEFKNNNNIEKFNLKSEEWTELLPPDFIKAMNKQLERLPFKDLFVLNKYHYEEDLSLGSEYVSQFWKRIFGPLTAIAMIFLSMPFVFTTNRNAAVFNRVFISALIGCTVIAINALVESTVSLFALSPMITALLPATVGFTIGLLAFYRSSH